MRFICPLAWILSSNSYNVYDLYLYSWVVVDYVIPILVFYSNRYSLLVAKISEQTSDTVARCLVAKSDEQAKQEKCEVR